MPTINLSTSNTIATLNDSTQTYQVTGSTKIDKVLISPEVSVSSMDLKSGNDTIHLPYELKNYTATVNQNTLTLKASNKITVKMNIGTNETDTLLFSDGFVKIENSRSKISIGDIILQSNKTYDLVNEIQLNASKVSETASTANDQELSIIKFDEMIESFNEGNKGLNTVKIKVLRQGSDLSKSASVNYEIDFNVPDASIDEDDISSNLKGKLVFKPEVKEAYIAIDLNADTIKEDDESFNLVLSNPSNAMIDKNANISTVTISNDDKSNQPSPSPIVEPQPTHVISNLNFSVDSSAKNEGSAFTYTLSLDKANTQPLIVDYLVNDVSTDSTDFSGKISGSIMFNAGETSKTIAINSKQDNNIESDETFSLDLSATSDLLSFKKSSIVTTIKNDDVASQPTPKPASKISSLDVFADEDSQTEGSTFNYTLNLDQPSTKSIKINYKINYLETDKASFSGKTSGSITFKPGETSKVVKIKTVDDSIQNNAPERAFEFKWSTTSKLVDLGEESTINSVIVDNDSDQNYALFQELKAQVAENIAVVDKTSTSLMDQLINTYYNSSLNQDSEYDFSTPTDVIDTLSMLFEENGIEETNSLDNFNNIFSQISNQKNMLSDLLNTLEELDANEDYSEENLMGIAESLSNFSYDIESISAEFDTITNDFLTIIDDYLNTEIIYPTPTPTPTSSSDSFNSLMKESFSLLTNTTELASYYDGGYYDYYGNYHSANEISKNLDNLRTQLEMIQDSYDYEEYDSIDDLNANVSEILDTLNQLYTDLESINSETTDSGEEGSIELNLEDGYESIDASNGSYIFVDDVSIGNEVTIYDFGPDDEIIIKGATINEYNSAIYSTPNMIGIAYNNKGIINSITLENTNANAIVYDVNSFNTLSIGDIIFG